MEATYELMVVTGEDKDDSTRSKQLSEVKKLIEADKGQVKSVDDWGKRNFAYKINKTQSGYYTLFTFQASPQTPNNLNGKLRLMEDMLRFLVVKKENEKVEKSEKKEEKETPKPKVKIVKKPVVKKRVSKGK